MKCPVCDKAMLVVERSKIELDHCIQCKGFWFDAEEYALLPQALGINIKLPAMSSYPFLQSKEKACVCPRCSKKMEKITLGAGSDLILDRCPKGHGLWFDKGELSQAVKTHCVEQGSGQSQVISFLGEVFDLNKE